jgi:cytochrome c biogenesis protein CcmG/thiol:disulfide interchange protein DsbE
MTGRGKLALQIGIACVVAALLGLLGWRMVGTNDARGLNASALAGERPQAPDFTLPRLDDESSVTLASLRGNVVVLNFWASWCAPCRDEAPLLESAWQRYRDRGVVFVGVDLEDLSSSARRFVAEYGITYTNVRDGDGSTRGRFGLLGIPETMVLDRQGRIVLYIAGPVDHDGELDRGIQEALAS